MHNLFIRVKTGQILTVMVLHVSSLCAPFLVQPSLCLLQLLQGQRPRRIQLHLINPRMSCKSLPVASPMKPPLPTQAWNSGRAQDRRATVAGAAGTKCQHPSNPLLQRPVGTITSLTSFRNAFFTLTCKKKSWREEQSVAEKGLYWWCARFHSVQGGFFSATQRQSWL